MIDEPTKQAIVLQALESPPTDRFFEAQEALYQAIRQDLLEQGVPEGLIDLGEGLSRARGVHMATMAQVARSLFPVDPLPGGAALIYDKDPVSSTESESSEPSRP